MSEPKISYAEFMKNINTYRDANHCSIEITEEQRKFLIACRSEANKVTWNIMRNFWEGFGWGNISTTTLRARYEKAKERNSA